jgi:anti-sigma regulatory factor (Ser/Thr protein kinase)
MSAVGLRHLRLCPCRPPSREVAGFVAALAAEVGLPPRPAYGLRLATDEITTNIVEHGYRRRAGVIELAGGVQGELVWLEVQDDAPPFDPRSYQPGPRPDPATGPVGGCGLLLTRRCLDRLDYAYVGGRNRTTLWIRRSDTGGEQDGQADRTCRQ